MARHGLGARPRRGGVAAATIRSPALPRRGGSRVRAGGERVWFVTNNALPRRGEVAAKLGAHGIDAGDDVVTSPMAAASLVEPGERVLVCGGPGVTEAVEARGAEAIDASASSPPAVDAVIVGLHLDFDYRRLAHAATAGPRRRPPHRHQRRHHLPGGVGSAAGQRLARRRRGHGQRRGAGGGRQALRPDGRPGPPAGRSRQGLAVGDRVPTPTAASPARSATGSVWCSPA